MNDSCNSSTTTTTPLRRDLDNNLEAFEVIDILSTVSSKDLSRSPPVLPKEGELYVFHLGEDSQLRNKNKRKFRCDQYRWVNKGVFAVKCSNGLELTKRSNYIDRADLPRNKGDERFRRWEFWGYKNLFVLHYTGDHSVFSPFAHRSAKLSEVSRPFIRSAPFVKEKVCESNPLKSNKEIYRDIINSDEGGPRHCIETPRNIEQVKNFRDTQSRSQRISHDALFNLYQLSFNLKFPDRRGEAKDFVSYLALHPRILVHLLPHPILESLEQLVKIQNKPTLLHYDTAFNVGDYYLSILSFRHALFHEEPIIPCGFLIHSRRYQNDHKDFLEVITATIRPLQTKQINFVSDREFKFSSIFPVGFQLHCWIHFHNDIHWYLRNNTECTPEESNIILNGFRDLMLSVTEGEMDEEWKEMKESAVVRKYDKVCQYLENNIIPSFKSHAAIWTLKLAGISNAENGLTNHASESMNAVIRRLQQWKQVPVDVIVTSLHHLCIYYRCEIERSVHQCGQWRVKDEFSYLKREPSLLPYMEVAPSPEDIVEAVRKGIAVGIDIDGAESFPAESVPANSDVMLARSALANQRVKLVDDGAWIVTNGDRVTSCAVRLFPKETCSCSCTRTCYHIIACRLMLGLPLEVQGKGNMSEMRRKERQKRERPAGRKKPRRADYADAGNPNKKSKTAQHDNKEDSILANECDSHIATCNDEIVAPTNNSTTSTVPMSPLLNTDNASQDAPVSCNSSYLSLLLSTKQVNVKISRMLLNIHGNVIHWSQYLTLLNDRYPGVLVANYVCNASFEHEISHLNERQVAVIQTIRSKQAAILMRSADNKWKPTVEIISTYQTPDTAELEYHAGVMLRRNISYDGFSFFAKHTGVQFLLEEEEEEYSHDVLLAALLYYICTKGSINIDRVRFDNESICNEVAHLVSTHSHDSLSYEFVNDPFCEETLAITITSCIGVTPAPSPAFYPSTPAPSPAFIRQLPLLLPLRLPLLSGPKIRPSKKSGKHRSSFSRYSKAATKVSAVRERLLPSRKCP
uniref:SWIM-type domain-containing protein n=1 Tax=Amphimedon queenslandica TaxID=400682 RepID=A0A1X7T231_AMPQE